MSDNLNEFLKKWGSRENIKTFQTAVRALAGAIDSPELLIRDVQNTLSENLCYRAKVDGYKIKTVDLFGKTFDYGQAIGLALKADLERDENATAILFISECYDQIIRQQRKRIELLELPWWKKIGNPFKAWIMESGIRLLYTPFD